MCDTPLVETQLQKFDTIVTVAKITNTEVIDLVDSDEDEDEDEEEDKSSFVEILMEQEVKISSLNYKNDNNINWNYKLNLLKFLHQYSLNNRQEINSNPSIQSIKKVSVTDTDILIECILLLNPIYVDNIIQLKSFYVHGKRFGDPKRKGKNKFCGKF
jgi:hypothetical protein